LARFWPCAQHARADDGVYARHGCVDFPLRDQGVWAVVGEMMLDTAILASLRTALPPADLADIFRAFSVDLRRLAAELTAHSEAGDGVAARHAAHALAGAAASVGATALAKSARAAMQAGGPPIGPVQAREIAAEAEAAIAALDSLAAE
jgi:HPt (histidine-containing phosphotransfer) domain-containing protein